MCGGLGRTSGTMGGRGMSVGDAIDMKLNQDAQLQLSVAVAEVLMQPYYLHARPASQNRSPSCSYLMY